RTKGPPRDAAGGADEGDAGPPPDGGAEGGESGDQRVPGGDRTGDGPTEPISGAQAGLPQRVRAAHRGDPGGGGLGRPAGRDGALEDLRTELIPKGVRGTETTVGYSRTTLLIDSLLPERVPRDLPTIGSAAARDERARYVDRESLPASTLAGVSALVGAGWL